MLASATVLDEGAPLAKLLTSRSMVTETGASASEVSLVFSIVMVAFSLYVLFPGELFYYRAIIYPFLW